MLFSTTQRVNLPACSLQCPFNAERRVAVNSNILKPMVWKTWIEPGSTATEANTLSTQPSGLLKCFITLKKYATVFHEAIHTGTNLLIFYFLVDLSQKFSKMRRTCQEKKCCGL